MDEIKRAVLDGKAHAIIDRVSKSGMTRYIRFYILNEDGEMENVTHEISKEIGGKCDKHGNLKVSGCGMDMIFHTLYTFLGYDLAKTRSQRYRRL